MTIVYVCVNFVQGFTFEEADKPDTYYQTPRQALEEEFDVRYVSVTKENNDLCVLLVFSLGSKRVFTNWFMTI